MKPLRAAFLRAVLEQVGAPYLWGGKGAVVSPYNVRAFDCSGLVTWALLRAGGPDWRNTHNTDVLLAKLPAVEVLQPGTLVLYGRGNDASHVMVHVGAGVVVGASGGGSNTTSIGTAQAVGARVKVLETPTYRADVLGYRELDLG